MKILLTVFAALLWAGTVSAQDTLATDVKFLNTLIPALYDVISGPADEVRDWNRFRNLFVPEARLIPVFAKQEGGNAARFYTPDEFATEASKTMSVKGFFEKETARRTEVYGNMAMVWSTYESRWNGTDEKPFARGINCIQLMHDGTRWWIVNIFWQSEDPLKHPLPKKYLKSKISKEDALR